MARFGIVSPVLGLKLDVPGMLLSEAFSPDNDNVRVVDGEIHRAKGPVKEVYDAAGEKIAVPRRIFAVTALAAKTFTVADDQSAYFSAGNTIRINGSTDNDGLFTVVSATFDVDHTDILVAEDIDTSDADGNVFQGATRVLRFHQLVTAASGLEYFFLLTPYHILRWNITARELIVEWEVAAGDGCAAWDSTNFNDNVIATNNSDAPLIWASSDPGENFEVLAAAATYVDKAQFVTEFENFLIFGHITEGVTVYAQRTRWCDLGDQTAWDSGDAGYADTAGNDAISGGFAGSGEMLYIFKERSIVQQWLVTSDDVFNLSTVSSVIGCRAPGSVVVDGQGHVFFYGTDRNLRDLAAGEISASVDKVVRDIPPEMLGDIRAHYIEEYDEVWWALPAGSSAAANNRILKYRSGVWNNSNLAAGAFGRFNRQSTMVWDDLPYATWEEWAWDTWDSVEGAKGYPIDLSADYDGYVYAVHASHSSDGEYFDAHFVLETDLTGKQELTRYKRLTRLQTYWRPGPTVTQATIEIKCDGEANWQPLATIDISGTGEYCMAETAPDVRAKSFQIRVSCDRPFAFLGLLADYSFAGLR